MSLMTSIPDVEELEPSQALPINPSKRPSISSAEESHATNPEHEQPSSSNKTKLTGRNKKEVKKGVKRQGQVMSERANC